MRWPWLIVVALAAAALGAACGEPDKPGRWIAGESPTDAGFDAGVLDGAPPVDAPGFCGNELHEPSYRPPNLYFVLDRSGSMADEVSSDGDTRYDLVRGAALDLVRTLGPLINVGAAVLPKGDLSDDVCKPGGEVLAVTRGDAVTGFDGPTTQAFGWATQLTPRGGTPIAATLRAVYDELRAVRGNTTVLLATDGAPNCNSEISCTVDQCIPHIEGVCGPDEDCCAPGGPGGPENCIDRDAAIEAVAAIHSLGIEVYVIGIPGSAVYAEVLDALAEAGGTAQSGATRYVAVDDLANLGGVLAAIAADTIECTFSLADPPTDRDMTNVYLDGWVVPYDPVDGWTWSSEGTDSIALHGAACQRLKAGGATTVQVVTGCPTETPR